MTLRPHQNALIARIRQLAADGNKRICAVAPTGSGKTAMMGAISAMARGRVLILADARKLVSQAAHAMQAWTGERVGVEMADQISACERIVVASTQSLTGRTLPGDAPTLIMLDEAHRNTLGGMAQGILQRWTEAWVIGWTATPYRSDERALSDYYQAEARVASCSMTALTAGGWLAPIRMRSIPVRIDLGSGWTTRADMTDDELDALVVPYVRELAREIVRASDQSDRRRIVVFTPSVKSALQTRDALSELGQRAIAVSGESSEGLDGDWRFACNCALLTTGWDYPAVDCVAVLRPTKSTALYSQMLGRGTRPYEGKKNLLVLDPIWQASRHAAKVVSPPDIYSGSGGIIVEPDDVDGEHERISAACADGIERDAMAEAEARMDIAARRLAKRLHAERERAEVRERELTAVARACGVDLTAESAQGPECSDATRAAVAAKLGHDRADLVTTEAQGQALLGAKREPPTPKMLQWLRSPDGARARRCWPGIAVDTHAGCVELRRKSFSLRR